MGYHPSSWKCPWCGTVHGSISGSKFFLHPSGFRRRKCSACVNASVPAQAKVPSPRNAANNLSTPQGLSLTPHRLAETPQGPAALAPEGESP